MKPSEKPIDRIDQFFKNKLDDHTLAPSENAWAKVEAGFSKKNNAVVWRWAAAVLLMGALISVAYWSQKNGGDQQRNLATKTKTPSPSASNGKKAVQKNDPVVAKTRSEQTHVPVKSTEPVAKQEKHEDPRASKAKEKILETEAALAQQYTINLRHVDTNHGNEPAQENAVKENLKVEATPKAEVASSKQKPIKLEFTLDAFSSEETVATTNEAKISGLKKVLNLAREMKQGEGPVGNLREKKDELFAHNFLTKGKERE